MTSSKIPLHERLGWLGRIRRPLRRKLFSFLDRIAQTDDARQILSRSLDGLDQSHPLVAGAAPTLAPSPYSRGQDPGESRAEIRQAVMVVARFRTGSTLLWRLFRELPEFTSYYEPLNERRWFDRKARGERVDSTHRAVDNYWHEYDGLEELGTYYQADWSRRRLYMGATAWDPDLKNYIATLIDRAPARPVLQFNRMDFRLPWLKATFPEAKIVHLFRNPRDQWCSSLVDPRTCPPDAPVDGFPGCDKFYLLNWAQDLKYQFPFLDPARANHAYEVFYYLWRLAFSFGQAYSNASLQFEELVQHPSRVIEALFDQLGFSAPDAGRLEQLIDPPKLGKWTEYADDVWFDRVERECEETLTDFFRRSSLARRRPLGGD